ncbi:MAG: hypothetical protein ACPLXC_03475 [Candidatus Pacearchaeota archaeon]
MKNKIICPECKKENIKKMEKDKQVEDLFKDINVRNVLIDLF